VIRPQLHYVPPNLRGPAKYQTNYRGYFFSSYKNTKLVAPKTTKKQILKQKSNYHRHTIQANYKKQQAKYISPKE